MAVLNFLAHFRADPDFLGRPAGLQKSPFYLKSYKKARSGKSAPRSPSQFGNFFNFGSIWAPFLMVLGVFSIQISVLVCTFRSLIVYSVLEPHPTNIGIKIIIRNKIYVVRV